MKLLTEYLDCAAKLYGNKTAIMTAESQISFLTLQKRAKAIAKFLIENGVEGQNILIYLPKGIEAIVAMFGVLYSGNTYIPLDIRAPWNYTEKMITFTQPAYIISESKFGLSAENVLDVSEFGEYDGEIISKYNRLAYILFTSGSTGLPKGVMISHERVIDYIDWAVECFGINENAVIGNQAPFVFTVSAFDIYASIATGATLVIIPEHILTVPGKLIDFLNRFDINCVFWVPSVYRHIQISGVFEELPIPKLKKCLFVGEVMPVSTIQYFLEKMPETEFYHLYGSTETDMTIYMPVERRQCPNVLPLGMPRKNAKVRLLDIDENGIGEICVAGKMLADGYYKDIVKTSEVFFEKDGTRFFRTGDLASYDDAGQLVFHGRKDYQFKHLGYRIEAQGIETVALESGELDEAAVIYDKENLQIVLFYTGQGNELALRKYLMSSLPLYMVPTRYVKLDEMIHTKSGKVDRIELKRRYFNGK